MLGTLALGARRRIVRLRLLRLVRLLRRLLRLIGLRLIRLRLLLARIRLLRAAIWRSAVLPRLRRSLLAVCLPPAVPVADAILLLAPPPSRVLTPGLLEHEISLAAQRRVVRLLPAELQHVAAQVAGEVADDVLALSLVHPDALHRARLDAAVRVVGLDLHGTESVS